MKPLVHKRGGFWRVTFRDVEEDLTEIPGYEGYYAATRAGDIYSLPRTVTHKNGAEHPVSGRKLRPGLTNGYWLVNLCKDGQRTERVHYLVALTFLGPRPERAQVRHLDGNSLNPHIDNLAYGTASENRYDSVIHGTHNEARKTECKYGHPFDRVGKRQRVCSACSRASSAKYRAKMRAKREADHSRT